MTIQHPPADPETDLVVSLGLPHLVRTLQAIFDSIDDRIGFLERRADIGRLPVPRDGIPDELAERYFALYSLVHVNSERIRSETEQHRSGTEQNRSEAERRAS